jgi:hypothetical protein
VRSFSSSRRLPTVNVPSGRTSLPAWNSAWCVPARYPICDATVPMRWRWPRRSDPCAAPALRARVGADDLGIEVEERHLLELVGNRVQEQLPERCDGDRAPSVPQ